MPIIGPGHDDSEYGNYDPANRYHGLSREDQGLLATVSSTTIDGVHVAHKAGLADWAREQQLRNHPDMAVLDAWLTGRPLARTRVSPFAALRPTGGDPAGRN